MPWSVQNWAKVWLTKQGPLSEWIILGKPYLDTQRHIVLQTASTVCPRMGCISAYLMEGSVITTILSYPSSVLGSVPFRSTSTNANGFVSFGRWCSGPFRRPGKGLPHNGHTLWHRTLSVSSRLATSNGVRFVPASWMLLDVLLRHDNIVGTNNAGTNTCLLFFLVNNPTSFVLALIYGLSAASFSCWALRSWMSNPMSLYCPIVHILLVILFSGR